MHLDAVERVTDTPAPVKDYTQGKNSQLKIPEPDLLRSSGAGCLYTYAFAR